MPYGIRGHRMVEDNKYLLYFQNKPHPETNYTKLRHHPFHQAALCVLVTTETQNSTNRNLCLLGSE